MKTVMLHLPVHYTYVIETLFNSNYNSEESNQQPEDSIEFPNLQFIKATPSSFLNEESSAVEYWNRTNKKQRKSSSYLNPNPHLRLLNINTTKNI